jgi:hypothetical protein
MSGFSMTPAFRGAMTCSVSISEYLPTRVDPRPSGPATSSGDETVRRGVWLHEMSRTKQASISPWLYRGQVLGVNPPTWFIGRRAHLDRTPATKRQAAPSRRALSTIPARRRRHDIGWRIPARPCSSHSPFPKLPTAYCLLFRVFR